MLSSVILVLLTGLGFFSSVIADTYCSADVPCEIGCCGKNNVCGLGPDYCAKDKCINNCDAKAECNPGDWDNKYINATTCPLNVCCSKFGFCGTTEEFCGDKTVSRPSCDASSQQITRVIGYYNSAAATRPCGGMIPQAIPQGVYSHLYFAFVSIDPDTFEVIPASEGDRMLYPQLEALQIRDMGQELWLSIGGWDFSDAGTPTATTFSDLVSADSKKQNAFFSSLTNFMTTWGFTGIDIDWEYPAADDRNGRPQDYKDFPKFMANLKKALSDYQFGLSVTLPTSYWYLQHFDLESLDKSVDWFNFMSYDLHGTWDMGNKWTGAYLDAHTNLTEIKTALDLLWRNDIKPSKVNMGMAFYGRSVTLASPSCTEPGCSYLSAGDKRACSNTAGVLFNNEIQQIIRDNDVTPTLYKDAAVKTLTWDNDQWVSYDDEDTWRLKAEFAKSECLGGVLVWSIDNDDINYTFSHGLAAALGNEINLDTTTGLTGHSFGERKSTSSSSDKGQDQYCRFINCGEVCPSGFTEVTRADKKKDLMLDSSTCPSGKHQTQTLCCPTSTEVPTCQWRGFHNNGKCKGGCNSDEAEIGTVGAGCKSGYQSACCTITDSVRPWTKCKWTESCHGDLTCPAGYPNFVVGSRDGWGGQKSCKAEKNYNYCCQGDTGPPDTFTDCEWHGHGVTFTNDKYCSTHCPAGSIRIAEEDISIFMGSDKTAKHQTACSVVRHTVAKTARELDAYLTMFLKNPVCPSGWDSEYSYTYSSSLVTRDKKPITDEGVVLTYLVPILAAWATSQFPRQDLTDIITSCFAMFGLQGRAGNLTDLQGVIFGYGVGDGWIGGPITDVNSLMAGYLCNLEESANGLENIQNAASLLCESNYDSSSLSARRVTVVSMDDRSENGEEPGISLILSGILNGELSLHYCRWLSAAGRDILELAFWIGPTPGVTPSNQLRSQYVDTSHTAATDRWIIFHLHFDIDDNVFFIRRGRANRANQPTEWYPGVTTIDVYHSQTATRPGVVTHGGRRADQRAEFRYSITWRGGRENTGTMQDYNARTHVMQCPIRDIQQRWYIGFGRERQIAEAERGGTRRPFGYTELLDRFGMWMWNQGIFSVQQLGRLYPALADDARPYGGDGWSIVPSFVPTEQHNPQDGAYDVNWLPDGSSPANFPQ
ncbi:glycoside hydrolase [Aspergillus caelatus]|uniref:chitinase n=1 Tax=Aspergillus caelatus TaxID=61420 RepID=A0A5N6ZVD9_9EURO|nr:glycoside hydrolase [Aspergillus caelatus]KAE8361527.1 glycoside hydrolase [Aspergillus caelatus]